MRVNRFLMQLRRDWERRDVFDPDGNIAGSVYRPRQRLGNRQVIPPPPKAVLNRAGLLISVGLAVALASVIVPFVLPLTA